MRESLSLHCSLWLSLAIAIACPFESHAQATTSERRELRETARNPAWAKDWPQFAAFAERYIAERLRGQERYLEPMLAIPLPDAVDQPVAWIGIYSRTVVPPRNADGESAPFVVLKLFPAIRARIDGCSIVGDSVSLNVPVLEIERWKNLKAGMAVRFAATLGTSQLTVGPNPESATAFLSRSRSPGECSLDLILRNPALLEAW
jgi:hypothetical protein